jgi:hypothetical protein
VDAQALRNIVRAVMVVMNRMKTRSPSNDISAMGFRIGIRKSDIKENVKVRSGVIVNNR